METANSVCTHKLLCILLSKSLAKCQNNYRNNRKVRVVCLSTSDALQKYLQYSLDVDLGLVFLCLLCSWEMTTEMIGVSTCSD